MVGVTIHTQQRCVLSRIYIQPEGRVYVKDTKNGDVWMNEIFHSIHN